MASALLISRNEPYWGEQKVYMRKNPNPNPNNPKLCTNPIPNPTYNFNQAPNRYLQPPPASAAASVAVSDDSSSFSHKPADPLRRRDAGAFVSFNVSSYSKKELRELKRRLMLELDQVRSVISRIESREFQSSARSDALTSRSAPKPNQPQHRQQQAVEMKAPEVRKIHSGMMKRCGQILTKLMKNNGAIWFNTPVDVDGMGLHDYHQIIKNPMDLGTVRSNLNRGFYLNPLDIASDIRLTFKNALAYNPQVHDVHKLADQLLKQFEGSFGPAYLKYEKQLSAIVRREEEMRQRALSWAQAAAPVTIPPPPTVQAQAQKKPLPQPPMFQQQQQQKQPKPKLNDPNKRAMSMKEKERLGFALQNLPEDEMNEVLQIIRKRNVETPLDGDEVEIDFELMDNETIWELDRFINWFKMISKTQKREEPIASQLPPSEAISKSPMASRKGDPVDEDDVDIGDEMPVTHYPSVEIEKKDSSSSSSSGSGFSSSSDSDSGSSSGSDSDDDNARSPAAAAPNNNM